MKYSCFAAALLLVTSASASRADPSAVNPPPGAKPIVELHADGVQLYTCTGEGQKFEWAFKGPEANLFDAEGRKVGRHFGGPTWKLDDGSAAVGEVVAKTDAPEPGAIQWLLLRVKSHEGTGALTPVAFIRRADTRGGVAPATGCDADHVGVSARMRYSAVYAFFSAAN
jgi:hypothetical protein